MEPERNIEKELKAYAQQRRAEAGALPELHPATRKLLQDEAARLAKKRGADGTIFRAAESVLADSLLRLAVAGVAAAAAVVVGCWIFPSGILKKHKWKVPDQTMETGP